LSLYDSRETGRRWALVKAWSPVQREIALHVLSMDAPAAFDRAARHLAHSEATDEQGGGAS
jgi:hypothetical protein